MAVVAITPNYEIGHNLKSMQINLFVCVSGTFSKTAQRMDTKLGEPTVLAPGNDLHPLWRVKNTPGVPNGAFYGLKRFRV